MRALITGASSGLGRDFAVKLSNMGYDVILVARDKEGLIRTSKECNTNTFMEATDLSVVDNCKELFNKYKDIDLLINNAGFGLYGEFNNTNLDKEINMIDLNIKSVHILTKLYLKEMIKKDNGRILNVASSAAFLAGPLMSSYYSAKSYVMRLTTAIYEELRRNKSKVHISVLCPGPVNTNFNNVANVRFSIKGQTSDYVTKYALNKMFKNKLIIIPGITTKLGIFSCRFLSYKTQSKIDYNIQKKKEG